ncbi:MAG: LacI family transcriptional regulator [Anaerolineaceae bacterium]|nr:MAG: LacI family transcriptional regulator [Anaerolineaceae bacterium]
MNIYDVSRKAGVSIATVSRVINGNSNVTEKTKEKVLKVIEDYGYTPNAFARGLGLNSMKTVGIMCADSSDPFLASAIYYLEGDLRSNGYDSLLCCTGYEVDVREKYLDLLLSKRTDAIILVGSNFVEGSKEKNQYIIDASQRVPIAIVNGALDGNNIYSTLCDDYNGVYGAVNKLKESGCSKILYLYNSKSYSGIKKLSGYLAAMGMDPKEPTEGNDYVRFFNGDINEVKDYLTTLHNNGLEFDAIVTADDNLAIGAIKYAKACNIKVPEQLSIIGYNNSLIAECSDPELTSVDNKLEAVCSNCVSTLMGVFAEQEVPLKTVFSAEIIIRETTRF